MTLKKRKRKIKNSLTKKQTLFNFFKMELMKFWLTLGWDVFHLGMRNHNIFSVLPQDGTIFFKINAEKLFHFTNTSQTQELFCYVNETICLSCDFPHIRQNMKLLRPFLSRLRAGHVWVDGCPGHGHAASSQPNQQGIRKVAKGRKLHILLVIYGKDRVFHETKTL